MKGQYLAIETVLTFGMGIALAIGTISVFTNYRNQMIDTTTGKEIDLIQSEMRNTVFHLKSADSGYIETDLPSDISGSDYTVSLDKGVRVSVNRRTFKNNFTGLNTKYSFEGTTDGGTVKLYKSQNKFVLRPG